jgi:hypothetical protein
MDMLVKEISLDDYRHTRKWIVDIDCGETLNYRGRVSSNSFFYGKHKRNRTDKFLYHMKGVWEEYDDDKVPDDIERVDSIWEFYKIIGYDYKKKKFLQ